MTTDIKKVDTELVAQPAATGGPISMAAAAGSSIEDLERLWALQIRYEENEAKKAYNFSIAQLKKESLSLKKDGKVGYTTKDKEFVGYTFATLASMVDKVSPLMAKHGITHSWSTEQRESRIFVTCTVSHEGGHSREVTLSAPPDTSGKKNPIQSVKSTVSYLERITFQAIMGLAAGDQDDDGAGAEPRDPDKYIDETQAADFRALLDEVGMTEPDFSAWCGLDCVEDIPANKYSAAVKRIESKRGAK